MAVSGSTMSAIELRRRSRPVEARRARRQRIAALRVAASPPRVMTSLACVLRRGWLRRRTGWTRWRGAFLAILGVEIVALSRGATLMLPAIVGWLVAGSLAWIAASLLELDRFGLELAHRTPGPSLGGYRLRPDIDLASIDPDTLLLVDLVIFIGDRIRVVPRRVRGQRGSRYGLETGIRDLSWAWARSRGLPLRRGSSLARQLIDLRILREVRISQATAWRPVYGRTEDAVRALEQGLGRQLIDWQVGRWIE